MFPLKSVQLTAPVIDEESKKATRRANYKDVVQDVAGIVIPTLERAAAFAPIPYLRQSAGLAITLVDMVQVSSGLFPFRRCHISVDYIKQ